jgi:hypothetical protein
MTKIYHFDAVGIGSFPTDMLRYDRCWPDDTESAVSMLRRLNSSDSIHLTAHNMPTILRWKSFGFDIKNLVIRSF